MALVLDPVWKVTFSFVDESGSLGKTQMFLPGAQTAAEVTTAVTAMATALQAITGASLRGVDANRSYTESDPAAATADHEVEERGQFVVLAGSKQPTYSVPAILGAKVKPNQNIDTADAEVIAFMDALIDGAWTDSNGTAITRVLKAYHLLRKTGERQRPTPEAVNYSS